MARPDPSKTAGVGRQRLGVLSRLGDVARWTASHVLRRRAAQLVLALLIAFAAAILVAILGPWSTEQRIILATIAGFVLFGTLLFYLGYRSWDLARRLSRESAKSREMLLAVHAALSRQNQKVLGYTSRQDEMGQTLIKMRVQQSSMIQALGSANEQWLQANSRAEQSDAALAALDARISLGGETAARIEILASQQATLEQTLAALQQQLSEATSTIQNLRSQQSGHVQGLGATNAQLLELASRSESMHGAITQNRVELAQLASEHSNLAATVGQLQGHLATQQDRHSAAIADARSRVEQLGSRFADNEQGHAVSVAALESRITDLSNQQGAATDGLRAVQGALEDIRTSAAVGLDVLAEKTATLEQLATSGQARLLSDLSDLRAAVSERQAAIAEASTALEQRITSLESSVVYLAEQDAAPLARLDDLEDVISRANLANATTLDELSAQIASLKDFTRTEAGRVAEVSATIAALGDSTRVTELSGALKSLGESVQGSLRALGGQTTALEQGLHGALRQIDATAARSSQSIATLADTVAALEKTAGQDSVRVVQLALNLDNLREEISAGGAEGAAEIDAIKSSIEVLADIIGTLEVSGAAEAAAIKTRLGELQQQLQALEEFSNAERLAQKGELDAIVAEDAAEREAIKTRLSSLSRDVALLSESNFVRLRELADQLEHLREADQMGQLQVAGVAAELSALQAGLEAGAVDGEAAFQELREAISRLASEQAETSALHVGGLAELSAIAKSHDTGLASLEALAKDHTISLVQLASGSASTADRVSALAASLAVLEASIEEAGAGGDAVFDDIKERIESLTQQVALVSTNSEGGLASVSERLADLLVRLNANEQAVLQSTRASPEMEALETSARSSETEVQAIKKGLADLSRNFGLNAASSRQVIEQLSDQFTSLREAMTGEFGRVGGLTSRLALLESAFENAVRLNEQELAHTKFQLDDLSGRVAAATVGMEGQISELSSKVVAAAELAEVTDSRLVLDSASWYEPNNRKLRSDHIELLESDWTRRLALDVSRPAIGYMTTRIATLERELDGRLRASIEDTLLRTLVARSVKGAKIRVLELGASFGVETAVMYDQLKDHFSEVGFTILDPLDTLATDARADRQTGLHVNERILRRNLARVGLPDGQVSVIKRLSTDAEAITQASANAYDVLIIDSDRSYAGLKANFETYARMVRLGGYIVFADYASPEWPDVAAFVDRDVAAAGHVAAVGASWRTAVYRVVRAEKAPSRTAAAASVKRPPAKRRKK